MRAAYPVFIKKSEEYYLVYIPDVDGYTEGRDFCDAISMARDYIGGAVISGKKEDFAVPVPSDEVSAIRKAKEVSEPDFDYSSGTLTYVDVDFEAYRRKLKNLSVKKNCTIPQWLSEKAEARGVNFSRVLQDALVELLQ